MNGEDIFYKLDMTGHKGFFEGRVKTEKDTLSEGVTKKDTRTRFGIAFVGIIGTQLGKTQTAEDMKFGQVRSFIE